MKLLTGFLFLLLIIACNVKEKKNKEEENNSATVIRDTIPVNQGPVNPYASPDLSPMDMVYFPADYPILKMTGSNTGDPLVRIIYSRPHKQGRKIFGELLKYGEPWRLGANEATEIQFFKQATIQEKKINPGRYIMYCIPTENKWTIVLNSNIDTWGLHQDPSKDLFRFEIPSETTPSSIEYFTMAFEQTETGADLIMTWDNVLAKLPMKF